MIENIQYKFKPQETSPWIRDGQEMCIHKGLTDYCMFFGIPCFVVQVWEGQDRDAHVVEYAIINKNDKQLVFIDRRHDVIEYIIENIASQMMDDQANKEKDHSEE